MTEFKTVNGNIFNSNAHALVNPVNCVGTMGAGLAKQFRDRYPAMHNEYLQICRQHLLKPGQVHLYHHSPPDHRQPAHQGPLAKSQHPRLRPLRPHRPEQRPAGQPHPLRGRTGTRSRPGRPQMDRRPAPDTGTPHR